MNKKKVQMFEYITFAVFLIYVVVAVFTPYLGRTAKMVGLVLCVLLFAVKCMLTRKLGKMRSEAEAKDDKNP